MNFLKVFFLVGLLFAGVCRSSAVIAESQPLFETFSPKDSSAVSADQIVVRGKIENTKIKRIMVNGKEVGLDGEGNFILTVDLTYGKNSIKIIALGQNGKILQAQYARILRLMTFQDLPSDYWAADVVEQLATIGILTGYPDGSFRPDEPISREELATILARLRSSEEAKDIVSVPYPDVTAESWSARYIDQAAKLGLINGYPDGTFRPTIPVDRVDAVAMIVRFDALPRTYSLTTYYDDISAEHWAISLISAARAAGFLEFIKGHKFEPARLFTRGETCWMLARTKDIGARIKDLMDYDRGYEK